MRHRPKTQSEIRTSESLFTMTPKEEALREADELMTGDKVLSPSREGGNGSVLVHLTGGHDGHWVSMPSRIPVALKSKGLTIV